jgi:hypothetical protein
LCDGGNGGVEKNGSELLMLLLNEVDAARMVHHFE